MRPQLEVAQVIDRFLHQLPDHKLTKYHRRTLKAIQACRTASLGGHVDACDSCGHLRISYNSCRNRHCPKCQGLNKEMWTIQQEDQLLPTTYFHVVFTLPHELNGLCLHNPRFMYDLLLRSSWYTLNTFARDPKWLGAKSAATMVLHTWGQTLVLHPHVHCIVPNGGLTSKDEWQLPKRGNAKFLYPVKALKKVFKVFFLKQMRLALEQGLLIFPPDFPSKPARYHPWKENLYAKDWVVHTKKPFAGVQHVVKYLARYSHRVAITNHRIKQIDQQSVQFDYKDYADRGLKKVMTLSGKDFIQRFCLHILPPGFRKVRQYGFLANASKTKDIAAARKALGRKHKQLLQRAERKVLAKLRLFSQKVDRCPCCQKGKMILVYAFIANKDPPVYHTAITHSK